MKAKLDKSRSEDVFIERKAPTQAVAAQFMQKIKAALSSSDNQKDMHLTFNMPGLS